MKMVKYYIKRIKLRPKKYPTKHNKLINIQLMSLNNKQLMVAKINIVVDIILKKKYYQYKNNIFISLLLTKLKSPLINSLNKSHNIIKKELIKPTLQWSALWVVKVEYNSILIPKNNKLNFSPSLRQETLSTSSNHQIGTIAKLQE
jgi:hypothetical protein